MNIRRTVAVSAAFFIAVFAIALGGVSDCRNRRHIAAQERQVEQLTKELLGTTDGGRMTALEREVAQLSADLEAHHYGASAGYVYAGGWMRFDQYARLLEDVKSWQTTSIPASTWTTIYTMPASVVGQLSMVAALAAITYDGVDASVNCDGGQCDTIARRWAPGRYQGGDFCRPDGVCANSVAGGDFSVLEDNYTPSAGIMTGALTRMRLSGASIILQVNCPATCYAAGGISAQVMLPHTDAGIVDAGPPPDSGPDAGPPCTLSYVAPNWGGALGEWPGTITLTGTVLASATATIGSSGACTSPSGSATTLTCKPPAFSGGVNGSTSPQTITVTTAGGNTCTTSGNQQNYFYFPSNNACLWAHRDDILTYPNDGGSTAQLIPDLCASIQTDGGAGTAWTQNTFSAQPAQGSGFNGTALRDITFNGSSQYMSSVLWQTVSAGLITEFSCAQYTSLTGGANTTLTTIGDQGGVGNYNYTLVRALSGNFQATDYLSAMNYAADDTAAHTWGMEIGIDGGGGTNLFLDTATSQNGSFTPASLSGVSILGSSWIATANTAYFTGSALADNVWIGALSSSDITTVKAIYKAVCATP